MLAIHSTLLCEVQDHQKGMKAAVVHTNKRVNFYAKTSLKQIESLPAALV